MKIWRKSGKHYILFVNNISTGLMITAEEYKWRMILNQAEDAAVLWFNWVNYYNKILYNGIGVKNENIYY